MNGRRKEEGEQEGGRERESKGGGREGKRGGGREKEGWRGGSSLVPRPTRETRKWAW